MDANDYTAFNDHLRSMHPNPNAPRSPIMAMHHYPSQPGCDTVLAVYDATPVAAQHPVIKLGLFGYCPEADRKYLSPEALHQRTQADNLYGWFMWSGEEPTVYRGPCAEADAMDEFVQMLREHANTERANAAPLED